MAIKSARISYRLKASVVREYLASPASKRDGVKVKPLELVVLYLPTDDAFASRPTPADKKTVLG